MLFSNVQTQKNTYILAKLKKYFFNLLVHQMSTMDKHPSPLTVDVLYGHGQPLIVSLLYIRRN